MVVLPGWEVSIINHLSILYTLVLFYMLSDTPSIKFEMDRFQKIMKKHRYEVAVACYLTPRVILLMSGLPLCVIAW